MPIYLGDTLQRGQSGAGAFPVAVEADLKVSSILVADLTARANIPSWKLMSKMLVYVISEDKNYRLEPDLVTWTEVVSSDPNALVYDDVFNSEGFIKSGLIQNLFINDSYVVASEAAMLALTTITGNAVIRTDTGQVFIKLNTNDPSVLADFADITGNTGAVTSVNGQTGSVSITIANLLAVAQNTTDFNTAVAAAPSVSTLIGAVSDLQTLYTTLSSNVSSIQITVSSLSTDVTTLQSDVTALQANLVIPDPTGHSTEYLTTPDGITLAWANAGGLLPSQAGQIGKFLTTDGTNAYWAPGGGGGGSVYFVDILGDPYNNTALTSALDAKEDSIVSGLITDYWRGDKTFQNLPTAVRSSTLTGLSITGSTISSTDTVLAAFGKLQNQVTALVGGVNYQGTWNATTNSPTLATGVGTKGYYYVVSVAGGTNLDGITDWKLGDWAIFNGTSWQKVDNTDAVISVNGYTGIVALVAADVISANAITNTMIRQSSGLSIIGRSANTTGDVADITGSANQILRVSGTTLGFGSLDLTASVGSSILPVANGGTGVSTGAWLAAIGVTLSGVNTITSNAPNQINFTGTWTGTASLDKMGQFGGTITGSSNVAHVFNGWVFNPSLTIGVNAQVVNGVFISPTFAGATYSSNSASLLVRAPIASPGLANIIRLETTAQVARMTVREDGLFNLVYSANGLGSGAHSFSVTGTSVSNNASATLYTGTLTQRATVSENLYGTVDNRTYASGANNQTFVMYELGGSFNTSGHSGIITTLLRLNSNNTNLGAATQYGLIVVPTGALNGFGISAPTETLHVVGSTRLNGNIGFYTATPVARATTAGAASTFAANTSLIANDTATFDGYTLGQVVKALRNIGLLT